MLKFLLKGAALTAAAGLGLYALSKLDPSEKKEEEAKQPEPTNKTESSDAPVQAEDSQEEAK